MRKRLLAFVGASLLLGVQLLAATIYVSDTFTDSNTTALTSHTGGTGATWTAAAGYVDYFVIDTNRVRVSGTQFTKAYASGSPATATQSIEADFVVQSFLTDDVAGLLGRWSTSEETGYYLQHCNDCSNLWELYSTVAGNYSLLSSSTGSGFSSGNTYRIKLDITGSVIKVYKDGVEITDLAVTNTDVSAANKCGLSATGHGADASTGIHFDNFVCTGADAASNKGLFFGVFGLWVPAWAR